MRKLFVALVVGLGLVFGAVAGPAVAHDAGPCGDPNEPDEPGHSEFAHHHVVFFAHEQEIGAGGHAPGEHQGYSVCQ